MISGNFWPVWLRRHKVVTALIGSVLAAALLLAMIRGRDNSKAIFAAARAARATADTLVQTDRLKEAEQSYRQALAALEKLVARWPKQRMFRRQLAEVVDTIGVIEAARNQLVAAETTDQQVITLWAMLVAEDPAAVDDRLRMAACINRLGLRLREAGRWDEAEVVYLRGRKLCENLPVVVSNNPLIRQQLAVVLEQLGRLLLDMGRRSEALECYASAVRAQKAAVDSPSSGSAELAFLVSLLVDQSRVLADFRHSAEAERGLVEAVNLAEGLRAKSPSEVSYQDLAASALSDLAEIIQAGPRRAIERRELLNRALAIREKLVALTPEDSDTLAKLAATYVMLADVHRELNSTGEAETLYRKALYHYSRLSTEHPQAIAYRFGHGQALHRMAELLRERGRQREGLAIARESIGRLRDVYIENIRNPEYRLAISHAYWTLCALELACKDHRATALAVREYLRIEPNGFEEALESARFLCLCVQLGRQDQAATAADRDAMARAFTDQAMNALRTAFRNGYRDLDDLLSTQTYEPLRGRDDFQRLVRDLEARVAAVETVHRS